MSPRLRALALAALIGALVPVVAGTSPAGAVDQDLVVSTASGAPGDRIDVSSASCVDDIDAFVLRYLSVRLISGTGPDAVLIGAGANDGPTGVTVVVPDWADPDEPAVIEATCQQLDISEIDDVYSETPYDPVAFDVLPGAGPGVQTTTFDRTELLVGQGFGVDAAGCTLADAAFGAAEVFAGDDPSGRSFTQPVTSSADELLGSQAFRVEPVLLGGGTSWGAVKVNDEPAVIDYLEEIPNPIEPGTYTAVTYCTDVAGSYLFFPPQRIEVTGRAPITDIELTADDAARSVELVGGSCTSGDVQASLTGEDVEAAFEEPLLEPGEVVDAPVRTADGRSASALGTGVAESAAAAVAPAPEAATGTRAGEATLAQAVAAADGTSRALADDGFLDEVVTPDAAGAWNLADTVGFDVGVVNGDAVCGDPLADGWFYDPQIVAVQSARALDPVPPTPAPAPRGAVPIQGSPAYTG